jgi:hypothetical protein
MYFRIVMNALLHFGVSSLVIWCVHSCILVYALIFRVKAQVGGLFGLS